MNLPPPPVRSVLGFADVPQYAPAGVFYFYTRNISDEQSTQYHPPRDASRARHCERQPMSDEHGFNFRWGAPWLDDKGYIQIPGFIKRHYAKLGIKPAEMMLVAHLSSYKYNTPNGKSRPSLKTIAEEMGYAKDSPVRRMVKRLEELDVLTVDRSRRGEPCTYDFKKLANKCMAIELASLPPDEGIPQTGETPLPQTGETPPPKQGNEEVEHVKVEQESLSAATAPDANIPAQPAEKPTKPPYWGDLIVEVAEVYRLPKGNAAKLAEQFTGTAPDKSDRGGENNCTPPAELGDVREFAQWYKRETGLDTLPEKADTVCKWWHRFKATDRPTSNGATLLYRTADGQQVTLAEVMTEAAA